MSDLNSRDSEENRKSKRGIFAALFRFFKISSLPGMGGVGGGGIFSSNAGIMGVILGGATIAAGVGVVYNFIGPSSKPLYAPGLFQNSYYDAVSKQAAEERLSASDSAAGQASSSLDYFKEEAKKDQVAGLASGEAAEGGSAGGAGASGSASAGAGDGAASGTGAGARPSLVKTPGFQEQGGSGPKLAGGGQGLSGGIGGQFGNIFNAPSAVKTGNPSAMSGQAASRSTAGRAVPGFNKKGAFGQAKYAGKVSGNALYSKTDAGMKSAASEAFGGGQANSGSDLFSMNSAPAGITGGTGLGAGNFKTSDSSLSEQAEKVQVLQAKKEEVTPWKKYSDWATYAIIAAMALTAVTNLLAKIGRLNPVVYQIAAALAVMAMIAAGVVMAMGAMIIAKHNEMFTGLLFLAVGGYLLYSAWSALSGVGSAATAKGVQMGKLGKYLPGYDAGAAGKNAASLLSKETGEAAKAAVNNDSVTKVLGKNALESVVENGVKTSGGE